MAPLPTENEFASKTSELGLESGVAYDGEIFLTGISGRFPQADSVKELEEKLFAKEDLITEAKQRWNKNNFPHIPYNAGTIKDIRKFDSEFFGVEHSEAFSMNHLARILLETVHECLIDAGVNPAELENSRTGVFIGGSYSEAERYWQYEMLQLNQNGATGCSLPMLAHRISNFLGLKGPSWAIDTACSSSMFALVEAVKLIRQGRCDAAIVCGAHSCMNPYISDMFNKLGVLSFDGHCKSFDEKANGYGRSEAIGAFYIQKAKDSRRLYAKVISADVNCDGFKSEGITYPAGPMQKKLLETTYHKCGINPATVEFVEAHGTGTIVGDPEELNAIHEFFCAGRSEPLPIGSIKSNLGHGEPSSGLNSIAKACIAYQTGYIPPNLNFTSPRKAVPGLVEGRMQVVTEKQPWGRGLFAISSFGFGGANSHVLLAGAPKSKVNNGFPTDGLPRLVCASGRTAAAVARVLGELQARPLDAELVRLWHAVHERALPRHVYRGYVLLDANPEKGVALSQDIERVSEEQIPPIFFAFSDLEDQWAEVAKSLMVLPAFADVIQRCSDALAIRDFKLMEVLNGDLMEQNKYSIIGTTAVHLAISDVLKLLGVAPDHIISYEFGAMCSAYAEECVTLKEAILAAYEINTVLNTVMRSKSVIKVGLNSQAVLGICPAEVRIERAGAGSTVVGGPAAAVARLAQQLRARGVPVLCPRWPIATLAKYIDETANIFKRILKEELGSIQKSSRWEPNMSKKKYSKPARIVIQIGYPDESQQGDFMSQDDVTIPLFNRDFNILHYFLTSLGRIYQAGVSLKLASLYPAVELPVSQETPMMAHLVEWDHSDDWFAVPGCFSCKIPHGEKKVDVMLSSSKYNFIHGHMIDGRVLYPATGYLVLVWQTFAKMMDRRFNDVSVVFEDVYLQRATNVPKDGHLEFTICIHESGKFEIIENDTSIVVGKIRKMVEDDIGDAIINDVNETNECEVMNAKDFYKELNLRGYQYKGQFRGVLSCAIDGSSGELCWEHNWVTFLDAMLQTAIVAADSRMLHLPTRLETLCIDTNKHIHAHSAAKSLGSELKKSLKFQAYSQQDLIRCGGVELRGVHTTAINKKPSKGIPVFEKNEFVANFSDKTMKLADIIRSNLQLIHENVHTYKFKTVELVDDEYNSNNYKPVIEEVAEVLADLPLIQADLLVLTEDTVELPPYVTVANKKISTENNNILFIGANLLKRNDILQEADATLKPNCFILSREKTLPEEKLQTTFDIITVHNVGSEYMILLRKKKADEPRNYIKIRVDSNDLSFSWIESVKEKMNERVALVLYSEGEPINGLLGLVNCLRREPGGEMVFGLLIADDKAPAFDPNLELYKTQLQKGLALNVLKNGQWGTYRHLLLDELECKPVAHAYANTGTIGDLSTLKFWEGQYSKTQTPSGTNTALVQVYCAALNFRDVMTSMGRVTVDSVARGRLAQDCVQGLEVSGRMANGVRVMGSCRKGLTNIAEVDRDMLWPVPDEWTLEEAATVPVAYTTVYMALVMMGRMRRGESILVHAGSGGVGQAAISVALHHGLRVFATVGTPAKRAFLRHLFPQLQDSHIGNSRDTSFEYMIRRETNGEGVDLVLNSLADDKLQASVKCLKQGGRFLEIGKYDITINTQLQMCFLAEKEVSFHSIMLDFIGDDESLPLRLKLKELVLDGIASGAVRPLTYCTFEKRDIEPAYRYMAAGKHIGKLIIKIRDEESSPRVKPTPCFITAVPRYLCDPLGVYVVVGGLGGFGLELADWLVLRGARRLLLASRRGLSNGYQALRIRLWRSYGAVVEVWAREASSEQGCAELLAAAAGLGPVRAVFNLAVRLQDAVFANQTPDSFLASCRPKALTTVYLDKLTRKMCPELRDFVVFSSVSCGRGNAGQTNYGFSNSVMERVCEQRRAVGLPATAIQWGAIGDVGLVADMQEENVQLEIGGTLQQGIGSCLRALDQLLTQDAAVVSSIVVAEKRATSASDATLVDVIAQIIGISDLKAVSRQLALAEMGMDSVMAVEIKQTLERDYELFLTAQEVRALTFAKLSEMSVKDSATEESTVSSLPSQPRAVGLEMLIRTIGDEALANEPYVFLKSAVSKESQDGERVVFLLGGVEGGARSLEPLAARLPARACALQLGLRAAASLDDLVDGLYKSVTTLLPPKQPFALLGYSFGSILMLKLAARLENDGREGMVFCLDGSPRYSSALARELLPLSNDKLLQNGIICHSFSTVCPSYDIEKNLMPRLQNIEKFEDKIKVALDWCPAKLEYSDEFMYSAAKVSLNRIKILKNLKEDDVEQIDSPVVLLRCKKVPIKENVGDMYGLDKITKGGVSVHMFEANHASITENEQCIDIVNKMLVELFTKRLDLRFTGN